MADFAELNMIIRSQEAQVAQQRLNNLEQQSRRTENANNSLTRSYGGLRNQISSLLPLLAQLGIAYAAIRAVKQTLVDAGNFEQIEIGMSTLLRNAEQAKKLLSDLEEFGMKTPFEFQGLAQSAKFMLALRFEANALLPTMRQIGDAASLLASPQTGGMQGTFDRIALALGQMRARGRVATQEMNQLTEVGINGWKYLADAIGATEAQVREFVEKGMINSREAVRVILRGMETDFGGGMERASKTLLGIWSNVMDSIKKTSRQVGDAIVEAFDLKGKMNRFLEVAPTISAFVVDVVRELGGLKAVHKENETAARAWADAIKYGAIAVAALVALKPAMMFYEMAKALAMATAGALGFIAANPQLLAALLAIGAVVATIEIARYFIDEFKSVRIAFEEFKESFIEGWVVVKETVVAIVEEIAKTIKSLMTPEVVKLSASVAGATIAGPLLMLKKLGEAVGKPTVAAGAASAAIGVATPTASFLTIGANRAAEELQKLRDEHKKALQGIEDEFAGKQRKGQTFGQFVIADLSSMVTKIKEAILPQWLQVMKSFDVSKDAAKMPYYDNAGKANAKALSYFMGGTGMSVISPFTQDGFKLPEVSEELLEKQSRHHQDQKNFDKFKSNIREEMELLGKVGDAREKAQLRFRLKDLTEDMTGEELKNFQKDIDEINASIDKLVDMRKLERIAEGVGQAFADSFTDAVFAAKSLEEAMGDLYMSVAKLIFQQAVAQPIASGITGAITGLFSAQGNVFDRGTHQFFAKGGVFPGETVVPMRGGVQAHFGEAGPEGAFPLKRMSDGRLGVSAEGVGGTTVVQNINIHAQDADSFRRSKPMIASQMRQLSRGM